MQIESIGRKIRRLREEKNISLSKLGGDFVSKAHLSYIENDKASPSIELLEYLASKLQVDLEYLLETEKTQAKKQCDIWLEEMKIQVKIGEIDKVIILYKDINALADKYELIDIVSENNYIMAQSCMTFKKYNNAIEHLENSIYYSSKNDDIQRVINCYIKQGNIYLDMSLYETAIQKYIQANNFYNQLKYKDLELESNIMYNLSTCYHRMKDKEKAIKYAKLTCEIDKKLNNKKRYTQSLMKYSATLILNREYKRAKEILIKANKMLDREDNIKTKAHIDNNLGMIYLEEGDYYEAFKHLTRSKKIKEELNLDDLPNTLFELYKYYLKNKEEDKALEELTKAINFSKERKLKIYEIEGLNYYVDYYLSKDKTTEALSNFKELISVLESTEMKKELLDNYLKLGKLYTNMGNEKQAIIYLNKAYKVNEDLR